MELRPLPGQSWPAFTAGAHIELHLPGSLVRSYSLVNAPGETHRYVLGILREPESRGGSRFVHEQLRIGMRLNISAPRNHFPLHEDAAHSVLVAGGIGITPILCMARHLKALGRSAEVIYLARSRAHAAFLDELQALGLALHLHFDSESGGPPDLQALLATRVQRSGTHLYACGPSGLLDRFLAVCEALGQPHAHIERFSAAPQAAAADARSRYTVRLHQSGRELSVEPGHSLLQTLLDAGVDVPYSCEEGICGTCETRIIEGQADHRDSVLTQAEKDSQRSLMVCVSGCKSETLVLDL